MARIAGINIPTNKHIVIGLQSIFGIGETRSKLICKTLKLEPSTKVSALTEDQLEAIRLADLEELYQEEAAERMNVSRPTFSRIIASAHKIISDAIINGKAIRIQGGNVKLNTSHGRGKRMRRGRCCGQT